VTFINNIYADANVYKLSFIIPAVNFAVEIEVMKKISSRVALVAVPGLALASFLGLSLSGDALAQEGWKALSVLSVLGCMALAGRDGGRTQVELRSVRQGSSASGRKEAA
jgi:hypothetical protein